MRFTTKEVSVMETDPYYLQHEKLIQEAYERHYDTQSAKRHKPTKITHDDYDKFSTCANCGKAIESWAMYDDDMSHYFTDWGIRTGSGNTYTLEKGCK